MRMRLTLVLLCIMTCAVSTFSIRTSHAQDPELQSIITYFDAMDSYRQGKADEALRALKSALRVFEKNSFTKGVFMTHLALSGIYRKQADYSRALDELRKAEQKADQERNAKWKALVLLRRGEVESYRSRFDEATESYEESLALLKRMQEVHLSAIVKTRLARILIIRGKYKEAELLLNQALKPAMDGGYLRDAAYAQALLGDIQRLVNNYAKAIEFLNKAEQTAKASRVKFVEQDVHVFKAVTLADQGSLSQAERILKSAAGFFTNVSDFRRAAVAEAILGGIALRRGGLGQADKQLAQAVRYFDKLGEPYGEARVLVDRARVLTATGDLKEAEKLLNEALQTFVSVKCPYGEMRARVALAALSVTQGRLHAAAENADKASHLATDLQSRQGQADSVLAQGRVYQAMGEDTAALGKIERALSLYRELNNEQGQVGCLMSEADSLIRLGFLERAGEKLGEVSAFPGIGENVTVTGDLHLLAGRIAQAKGDESAARVEYKKAAALFTALAVPFKRAALFEEMAVTATRSRSLTEALSLWEKAEKIYSAAGSRRALLRCRSARANLVLDLGDDSRAAAIVRQNRRARDDEPILTAYQDALKAEVALASGDAEGASRVLQKALAAAAKLKNAKVSARLNDLAARVYAAQGDYGKALESLNKAGVSKGRRFDHFKAMALVRAGKAKKALPLLKQAVEGLLKDEEEVGVWQVSPGSMRYRARVLEDYLDTLMAVSAGGASKETAGEAWRVAQRLKMRRIFYDLASVGAVRFPGVGRRDLEKLKSLQYRTIESRKRKEHPSLAKEPQSDDPARRERSGEDRPETISTVLDATAGTHTRYVTFVRADPPSVEGIKAVLKAGEAYVAFTATRNKLHVFVVSTDSFKSATAAGSTADIEKTLSSIRNGVSKPYYLGIDKSMNEMWNRLFGSFRPELNAAKHLVVETDAFLTLFPFEALIPGKLPESYKERQAAPLLLEVYTMDRTTSAFAFLAQRKSPSTKVAPTLEAYESPDLPKSSRSSGNEQFPDSVLNHWKRSISRYESSPYAKKSEQGLKVTRIFGKHGKLLSGEEATRMAFLKREPADYSLVHFMCPVLIPSVPAGKVQQPYLVFSPEGGDQVSGLCGVEDLLEEYHPAELFTLVWLGSDSNDPSRGATLLLETLGLMGIRHVVLPLWPADSQGEEETDEFMARLYTALKDGDDVSKAFVKAREALKPTGSRKNRANPARMVLF